MQHNKNIELRYLVLDRCFSDFRNRYSIEELIEEVNDYLRYKNTKTTIECANKPFIAPDARVLLVDDNPMNIRVEKELLSDFQFEVDCAVNGAEAIEMLREVRYDLVFMDYMMPLQDNFYM